MKHTHVCKSMNNFKDKHMKKQDCMLFVYAFGNYL